MPHQRNGSSPSALLFCQRGVASIEFVFTVFAFIFMVFFIAEISRLAYISAVIDLSVSESAKDAKNAPATLNGDYQQRFNDRLLVQGGSLWRFLSSADATSLTVTYADSISDMISTGGTAGYKKDQPLARYQLIYQYHPMFFPFPQAWANKLLNREVIFVQEYERSKFMD